MNDINYALTNHLRPIEAWLSLPSVTDICLNPDGQLWVESNSGFDKKSSDKIDQSWLSSLVSLCARFNACKLDFEQPLLQGKLPCGARIQICLPPITDNISFVIRRHQRFSQHLNDYMQDSSFINLQPAAPARELMRENFTLTQLRQHVIDHKNIIIAGGTGSGKTTFLRALLAEAPLAERLILLEDTPELKTIHDNVLPLAARGNPKFDMQLLLKTALRCRPDRIIMGEIRDKALFDFISSLNSGHSGGMATIHAGSVAQTWQRMVHLYKQNHVPAMTDLDILNEIKQVIDCIVVLKRTSNGRQLIDVYEK